MNIVDLQVILVAGGRGARLTPLTNKAVKPMVEIAGKPILEHILKMFMHFGFKKFIISVCFRKEQIINYFGSGRKFGMEIKYIEEDPDHPLGTAGGLCQASKLVNKTFIIAYADILRELDILDMLRTHQQKKAFATINVYQNFGKNPKSSIKMGRQYRVIEFIERPDPNKLKEPVWSNGSLYIFEPEISQFIEQDKLQDFGKDIFPKLIKAKKPIYAYSSSGYFLDISNIEKLNQAKKDFREGKLKIYD